MHYTALVVDELENSFSASIKELAVPEVQDGEVLIKVAYSSVNYKDALSFSGNKGVTRNYPHTPGIDAAGEVVKSNSTKVHEGDKVLVTGYDLGMNTNGGFGEYICVPADWVIKASNEVPLNEYMAWGTAGLTAALCIDKLLKSGLKPGGSVLVSGATGGVGSISIMLLSKLGYEVHALTSKDTSKAYLTDLGANEVHLLKDFIDDSKRPMLKPLYDAGIDVAGGNILSTMLKVINYGGSISCCGLVASPQVNTSVFPFILRDISLLGVDSVEIPLERKQEIWDKVSTDWRLPKLVDSYKEISMQELIPIMTSMLEGKISGRFVLKY